jgi:hypothetical protein
MPCRKRFFEPLRSGPGTLQALIGAGGYKICFELEFYAENNCKLQLILSSNVCSSLQEPRLLLQLQLKQSQSDVPEAFTKNSGTVHLDLSLQELDDLLRSLDNLLGTERRL